MKTNTTVQWKISKALGYFFHFIDNFDEAIEENDVFELVASLRSSSQWETLIKKTFSEETLSRMKAARNGVNRLDFTDSRQEILREIWHATYARKDLRKLIQSVVSEELKVHQVKKNTPIPYEQRLLELQRALRLNDLEREALLVLAFLRNGVLSIPDLKGHFIDYTAKIEFVTNCLDCDEAEVQKALSKTGKLRRYGCIDDDLDFNKKLFNFLIGRTDEPLENDYYIRWQGKALPWSFFGDLAKEHGPTLKMIVAAAKSGKPTHILVYGPPGSGKTSFALSFATELNRICYLIRQNVSGVKSRGDSSPENRLCALQICAEQVDPDDCIIIVDEADKMLRGNENSPSVLKGNISPSGDKCLLNSVLDSVRVPTIWITNSLPDALDETCRRRFDYAIRFEPLNQSRRRTIWHDLVAQKNLEHLIDDAMQERFAALYPVSLGGIDLVLQNVKGGAPRSTEVESLIEKLMESHCRMFNIPLRNNKLAPARDYSLEGLNIKGSISLEQIVQAVKKFQTDISDTSDRPRMNVLLTGDPGTGKTEFVKYLGMILQTRIIIKMGSDLLDSWVGSTEQNIRNAFETAEKEKGILFLDEIDGMTQSRSRATHSWEVTHVNELLHCMDNFNGIMIGATNFLDNLDRAVLRRFTYKLEFDYLDEAGKKLFFERMFRTTLTPEEYHRLAMIPELAPGDFRTVRQSFYYLGGERNNSERIDALARESEIKHAGRNAPKQKIGF